MNDYEIFIERKSQLNCANGFKPLWLPDCLFDFQKFLVEWICLQGCGAVFADCGLGKTLMQLVWAQNVVRRTNKPVLIVMPLAVSMQTELEGAKFGIECDRSKDGKVTGEITLTNYENLHKFNPDDFGGVALDESSILKNFKGVFRQQITVFMRKIRYRSLWTATAAPNDFTELGTSSEALGHLGHMDMLGKFFKNDQNNCATGKRGRYTEATKWRFKGHAELAFWRWVCSWARVVRKPSDIGFSDERFVLPRLIETQHIVKSGSLADGYLFQLPAAGLKEQRNERRRSIRERCVKLAELVNGTQEQFLVSCHLNDESELLSQLIPDSVEVSGNDDDDEKEEKILAFISGKVRRMISKSKIIAWGLNMQNCHRIGMFPSHSYEQYYQLARRCYRFGQKIDVTIDVFASEGELNVLKNMQRKARQADQMFTNLVAQMNNALAIKSVNGFTKKETIPSWLTNK